MKSAARITLIVVPWILLALIGVYLTYGRGLKDVTRGIPYRKAEDLFLIGLGGNLTKIEIRLLAIPPEQEAGVSKPASITLTGKDLEQFLNLWHYQRAAYGRGGMCHDPPYEFSFFQDSEMIARTTVCWTCANITLPDGWPFRGWLQGFNRDLPAARELLAFCDQRLPYHRSPADLSWDSKPDPASAESPSPSPIPTPAPIPAPAPAKQPARAPMLQP